MLNLETFIRDIPDFPKEGIVYKDITPLLLDPQALVETGKQLALPYRDAGIDAVVGIESRGFIFGSLVAAELGVGFIPIRKPGKLPSETIRESYELEYGTDTVEIHADAIETGQTILMIDDLLATGGTMAAGCKLVERLGGVIAGVGFVIELSFLPGRYKLAGKKVTALIDVAG